jgi:predicted ATPase/GAF domain-containing protein/tRNA A-37 threonylcarbamoyl transferase component Bud32
MAEPKPMMLINYNIVEKIAEAPSAAVYKAYHKKNPDRLLVLKILKSTSLSEYKQAQFQQKIEHLKVLNDPLVITPVSLGIKDGVCFITQDYFDGVALDHVREAHSRVTLSDFLTIACRLAKALDKVHEAGIIHGGIKPHNILLQLGTLDVRLIDFISAVDVRDVSHFIYDRTFVRETLAYTSPEQTGRINHRVVFSSDLYSLGVVFYELLTGRLPFSSEDPLELIHAHLAKEAPRVHEVNPNVPVVLSNVIAKLMLKQPEKRYQSGSGLLADLTRCKDEFSAIGTIREFPLEKSVSAQRVTFISKMVGRDREAELILKEYEEVARGGFRSLFISGLSGIGKTRLIQELQKPIVKHRGYFTSGKFDVYQKNIPYSSLIQALKNLMRTFLTESDERVAQWKSRLLKTVGKNGKVLTDVIPELEMLIGVQPGVKPLPPVESLNRFHDVFDRFLACLASEENPLALFIDDLQWCDVASFDFLTNVLANHKEHPYLFLLGAYRNNEVDPSHPLSKLIRNARDGNWPLKEARLEPLKPQHCHEMVSYILDSPRPQTRALSEFIATLSEGNPLFVSESLSYLHNEDLLFLDDDGQWRWDLAKINQSPMPTTVVALFSAKIQRLPADLVDLLKYCACMGNTFSPAETSALRGMTLLETFEILKPALRQGLLMETKNHLQFIHDRVQEAVLASIPPERRRQIHRQVGEHLLSAVPAGADIEKVENLFTIVSHLNLGREDDLDPKTAPASAPRSAYVLSDLNYHAGNKALDSLATGAASEYFNLARGLLPKECWNEEQYERTFKILKKAAKTELMCGNYGASERLLTQLLDHAKTELDKAECLAEQTTSLSSIGNFIKAIETANRGLAFFGKAIPENAGEADARRKQLMADIAAKGVDVWQTILDMPFTSDRRSKNELAFYSELIPDLYMSGLVPQLYLSAAQSTQHCLAGGMDESVIYSFSIMGLQLGEQDDFGPAFKYEDLAKDLSAKYPNTFGATRGMNGIVWCNMHSRSHPRQIVDYCLKSIQCGKNCGDLYNAGLSYGPLMWNLQVQGADLSIIEDAAKECLQFSNRYHLSFSVGLAEAMQAGWIEPMKRGHAAVPMEEKLRKWEQENHIASAGSYYVHRGLSHYYLGEHEEAQRYLLGVRRYLSGLTDNVLKRQWHVFLALNLLKLFEAGAGHRTRDELMAQIRPLLERVEKWAALGPLLKPYLAFLYAELERVTGGFKEARNLYLDAINLAHEQKYTLLEGHLNECLGKLLLGAGHCSERVFFVEAARLYRRCRAERKEVGLIEEYPECYEEEKPTWPPLEVEAPASYTLPDLDFDYLMKSYHAISSEKEQEALQRKIMNVVLESSGAQHGYLLIEENANLFLRAESHAEPAQGTVQDGVEQPTEPDRPAGGGSTGVPLVRGTEPDRPAGGGSTGVPLVRGAEKPAPALMAPGVIKTTHQKLEEVRDVCRAIIRYVYRTGERVILDNATQEGAFKDSPEVQGLQARSVLCLPVVKQSKTIGILYLENRLSEAVFTAQKTRMTELLTSWAALSLENARLVDELGRAQERASGLLELLEQKQAPGSVHEPRA